MQQWDLTQRQVNLFLAFGDGIYSNGSAVAAPNRCSGKKLMTYDWTIFQTLIFIITPLFVMLALTEDEDDDGPPDGGVMTPAFAPSPS